MKAFEIFEADEVGTGILGPDGREITRPATPADAPDTSARTSAPDTPSTNTPRNTLTIEDAKALNGKELEIKVKPSNGPSVTLKGTPDDIVKKSLDLFDDRAAGQIIRRVSQMSESLLKNLQKLESIRFMHSLGFAITAGQIWALFREYSANVAALEVLMGDRFVSSAQTDRIFQMAKSDMRTAFIAAVGIEIGVLIGGGFATARLIRSILRWKNLLFLVPGAGWVAGLLVTLAVEGAWFAISWAFTKYGPAYIADWFASDMAEDGGWIENQTEPMDTSDIEELDAQLQRDEANNRTPVDGAAVNRISQRLNRIQTISQQAADDNQDANDSGTVSAADAARARLRRATGND
jgi:hypothetical protein